MKQLANPLILKWVKYDHNFAGVGAGHAREPLGRGHGPLLQLALLLMQIGITPNNPLACRSSIYRAIDSDDRAINCAPTMAPGSNGLSGLNTTIILQVYERAIPANLLVAGMARSYN